MTLIEHTAYPRLKRTLTPKELDQIFTPSPAELFLAHRTAKGPVATLGFLIHLKVFQRLGYAVATSEIPASIIDYIAACAQIPLSPRDLAGYDDSGTRRRHPIWLTFGDRRICDRIENNCSFIFSSHGAFPYPDVYHSLVCLTFWS